MKKILKNKIYGKKGFTLVEVIVVIVIIAILAAVAVPALTGYIQKAKDRSAASEGRNFLLACQSAGVWIFGTEDAFNASQEGLLNWNAGSIQSFHYNDGSTTSGFSMVANPKTASDSILTANALKEVAEFMGVDQSTVRSSLYGLIVQVNGDVTGKSDSVAGFVYKVNDNSWVAYNSKDGDFKAFPTPAEGLAYAKKCSLKFI